MTNFKPAISFQADTNYIPALDGVRAISILIVIISHLGFGNIIPGGLGVTVFFFVSGFLITRLLVSEQNQNNGRIRLKNFYIRRFLRLMPALYVFILIISLAAIPFGGKPLFEHIIAACLYLVNYYDVFDNALGLKERIVPWGHLWSLAVEEHFYIFFPFALTIFGKNHGARIKFIFAIIVFSMLWRYFALAGLELKDEYTYMTSECRLENIAWGCLLAVLMDGAKGEKVRLKALVGWPLIFIALGLLGFSLIYRDEIFRASWRYTIQGIAIFILILNLYAHKNLRFAINILDSAPFRFIGRLSYSLYLWHWPVIWAFAQMANIEAGEARLPLPFLLATPIIALGLAMASYYIIEKPFFALRKKFGGKPVEEMRA